MIRIVMHSLFAFGLTCTLAGTASAYTTFEIGPYLESGRPDSRFTASGSCGNRSGWTVYYELQDDNTDWFRIPNDGDGFVQGATVEAVIEAYCATRGG
jgi:hypothetical protein